MIPLLDKEIDKRTYQAQKQIRRRELSSAKMKKFDRVKQWAGEKMGAETKTNVSDEFKALEVEMTLRHEGMEKLQKSMTFYVKALSKRTELEDKEKLLPVGYLGQTMITHGEDFDTDSVFGNCLIEMGRANDRIAREQEKYIANVTVGWLESLERSLAQMKEYQASRKKLEQRRLAYDTSLSKMQKTKKEDFRVEEELRAQKAKYEESSEDVYRRMQDIKEAESEVVADLGQFLEAEIDYYDRCKEELLELKKKWPAGSTSSPTGSRHAAPSRARSNTAHSFYAEPPTPEPEPPLPQRPSIRSTGRVASSARLNTHDEERFHSYSGDTETESPLRERPYGTVRSNTFQGPTAIHRESTTPVGGRKFSIPIDAGAARANLRPPPSRADLFGDNDTDSDRSGRMLQTPDSGYRDRSVSPAGSQGSAVSRGTTYSGYNGATGTHANGGFVGAGAGAGANGNGAATPGRKGPPPPPPSRNKKPPPPPPMKRVEMR